MKIRVHSHPRLTISTSVLSGFNNQKNNQFSKILEKNTSDHLLKSKEMVE